MQIFTQPKAYQAIFTTLMKVAALHYRAHHHPDRSDGNLPITGQHTHLQKFCQMRCIGEGLMVKTLDNQLVRMDNLLPWLATSIIKIVGNVFKSEHPYDFSLIPQKTW